MTPPLAIYIYLPHNKIKHQEIRTYLDADFESAIEIIKILLTYFYMYIFVLISVIDLHSKAVESKTGL